MTYTIRDDRVDPGELEKSLDIRRSSIEKARPRVRDRALAREARNLCRDDNAYVTRCYTAGVPVGERADAPVRDVPEYPTDLADYARTAGLPKLDDSVRLPAVKGEPAPPELIEPDEARRPTPVSGTVTRAG